MQAVAAGCALTRWFEAQPVLALTMPVVYDAQP
jgi:hypothetical protein